ncbi:hypothetical protein AYO40_06955 [Planctomycetaceae bacterium SCGC AG-212-D15]|nr:hypothetical protein AYO40_06955 [Planctomycetaceae bacterium SCGC AG-212-D15]
MVVSGGLGWFLFPKGSPTNGGTGTTAKVLEQESRNSADPTAIFRQASPAVVWVLTQDEHGRPLKTGSGFFISKDGHVATNYHVVDDAYAVHIVLADNTRVKVLGAVAIDEAVDIAILKVPPERSGPALTLTSQDLPPVGSKVFAIGNPQGLTHTLSEGLVSGHREARGMQVIQTTAPISPGSSGGPLLASSNGEVVGVTTAALPDGQNLNFAVPVSQVKRLLRHADKVVLPFAPAPAEIERIATEFEQAGATIPRTLARNVTSISFENARLAGLDLRVLRYFPDLAEVSLRNPDADDGTLAQLARVKVERLNLFGTRISDAGLQHLKTFPNLKMVAMGKTRVTDRGLVHLRGLTRLEYVGLRGDDITDAGLVHLKGLKSLRSLHLGETKVTDRGLVHLQDMRELRELILTTTEVTAEGVSDLGKILPMLRIIR